MEIYFNQSYSFLIITGALLTAFLVALLVYKNRKDDILSQTQKRLLFGVRFVAFFIIALLLSKPVIKHIKNERIDPVVIVAVDNSESVKNEKETISRLLGQIKQELPKKKLVTWTFGEKASPATDFLFNEKQSNHSDLFSELSKSYLNGRVEAVLLLGDGINNQGQDPAFTSKTFPFPVYSLGLGDTTHYVDAAVESVKTNSKAFINTYFPVEVNLHFSKASGQQATISIKKGNTTVLSKNILIASGQFFYSDLLNIKAEQEGINTYQVEISPVEGEVNLENNHYEFSIQVIAEKQKILLVGASVHPDLGAIKKALEINPNYEVEMVTGLKQGLKLNDYDLLIAHQLPNKKAEFGVLAENLIRSNRPVLFIVGHESSVSSLNAIQQDIQFKTTKELYENTTASINNQFPLFQLPSGIDAAFSQFPPLLSPFGDLTASNNFQVLAYQTIKGISTPNPLIVMGPVNKTRRAYIFGEGIWRWRVYDYIQNGSHKFFDDMILKMANYLIIKPNEDNFNIHCQPIFTENEPVVMQAELFNASSELVNEPDIEIDLISADSIKYHFTFDRQDQQYQLNAGRLPVGDYSYLAKTKLGEEELLEKGNFRINISPEELLETKADHQTLMKIAENTGGQFYMVSQFPDLLSKLKEEFPNKRESVKHAVITDLLDDKIFLFIVVVLLSLEWFLRKFWGTY